MREDHIDTVKRACAAWCDGDISIYREMYAPDVVASGGRLWPEGEGSVDGVDAVIANFEQLRSAFERSELIPEAWTQDGGRLVVRMRWRGTLRGSDSPVEQRVYCAYRFKDRLIAFQAWFAELAEALAALDMPPSVERELRPLAAGSPLAGAAQSAAPAS